MQLCLDKTNHTMEDVVYTKNGKPCFRYGGTYFNLSHSGEFTVCVLSDKEAGVDLEKTNHFEDRLANFVYHRQEREYIQKNYDQPDEGFTFLWTVKESIMKYFGTGLSLDPKKIHIDLSDPVSAVCDEYDCRSLHFTKYDLEGYALTVCSESEQFSVGYSRVILPPGGAVPGKLLCF